MLGGAEAGVCGGPVAVLEDLDADHLRLGRAGRQGGQVAADEAVTVAGRAGGELGDRGRGDVQAGEVQPGCGQRQVVAAVTAADVKAAGHTSVVGSGDDVPGEGHGGSSR